MSVTALPTTAGNANRGSTTATAIAIGSKILEDIPGRVSTEVDALSGGGDLGVRRCNLRTVAPRRRSQKLERPLGRFTNFGTTILCCDLQ